MSLLDKIFRRKAQRKAFQTVDAADENGEKMNPDHPEQFADWIFVNGVSMLKEDFSSSIPDESRESWSISKAELQAYSDEAVIMLGLGAFMFTGLSFSHDNHMRFKKTMATHIAKQIYGGHLDQRILEIESVFDLYLEDLIDRERTAQMFIEFSAKYIRRVFPVNPNASAMFTGAVIAKIPLDLAISTFELTRNFYCKLKHGISFEDWCALENDK